MRDYTALNFLNTYSYIFNILRLDTNAKSYDPNFYKQRYIYTYRMMISLQIIRKLKFPDIHDYSRIFKLFHYMFRYSYGNGQIVEVCDDFKTTFSMDKEQIENEIEGYLKRIGMVF